MTGDFRTVVKVENLKCRVCREVMPMNTEIIGNYRLPEGSEWGGYRHHDCHGTWLVDPMVLEDMG